MRDPAVTSLKTILLRAALVLALYGLAWLLSGCRSEAVKTLRVGTPGDYAPYSLKTDDGVIIYIENKGIRTATPEVLARLAKGEDVPPSEYYMRTSASFEVKDGSKYDWLNKAVVISTGMRKANSVILRFYKVL